MYTDAERRIRAANPVCAQLFEDNPPIGRDLAEFFNHQFDGIDQIDSQDKAVIENVTYASGNGEVEHLAVSVLPAAGCTVVFC
jgi:hypothetical protein